MTRVVLDASAVLALLFQEAGSQTVIDHLPGSMMSAVNLAEVLSKTMDSGMPLETSQRLLAELPCDVVAFDAEHAALTAALRQATRTYGLSLGDRSCLALGLKTGWPVVTADRHWDACNVGVDVKQIRKIQTDCDR